MVTQTVSCYHCTRTDLIRFGFQNGRQRYRCRACGKTGRENKGSNAYDETLKARILAAYHERGSLRAMTRTWLTAGDEAHLRRFTQHGDGLAKKAAALPPLKKTLAKAKPSDVRNWMNFGLSSSSAETSAGCGWPSVSNCVSAEPVRPWRMSSAGAARKPAACSCTGRPALADLEAGRPGSWQRVPPAYKRGLCYTDFWAAYADVQPQEHHRATGKGDGQTCHPNQASHRALQQHFTPAAGPLRSQDALVFQM